MEWAPLTSLPGQLGALGAILAFVGILLRLVFTGKLVPSTLVPRSTLEDVRADRDARIAQAEKDRDERIADAERDTERAWGLYEKEQAAHALTRKALLDQALGVTAPALAVAETTEKILIELQPGGGNG
ncbi:hypothetical protein ACFWYW_55920 [Nonomuraea sp. NPDC059023]|uniref:hypothetical protein n=1 Tax=unclassified Nonomuraea TaxID=2593643 RepID=UPI00369E90A2